MCFNSCHFFSYRSSDRSDGGSFRSDDPGAIQSYPYGKPSAESWRTKSDTNLSREPSLSYPATMSSFEIDRNPEADGVRRENMENRMRWRLNFMYLVELER